MELSTDQFNNFKGLTRRTICRIFGKGRTFRRGQKFAKEGYIHSVKIRVGESDSVVSANCWASQSKDKRHKVFIAINLDGYDPIQNNCSCTAGLGRCSHQCAVYHYLCAGGAFVRSIQGDSEAGNNDAVSSLSCTSQPRQWGIPARRIEPSVPIENISFRKVTENKEFQVANNEMPPESDVEVDLPLLQKLHANLCGESMSFLRYFRPGVPSDASDEDDVDDGGDSPTHSPSSAVSLFDNARPKPIKFPPYLHGLATKIESSTPPNPESEVAGWCQELEQALLLSSAKRELVCRQTKEQHESHVWYMERICRLTASKFGLICKRRAGYMRSLVHQLLYVDPPVNVPALVQGRLKEPLVVDKYVAFKEREECLLEVEDTGLHVHTESGFLAASPDRLVTDFSCEPSAGLLEVKYISSLHGKLDEGLSKAGFCLARDGSNSLRLKQSHNYYYQVQGQMACTNRTWCDFACMSAAGDLHVERIYYDAIFWESCKHKLTTFFRQHLAMEIVCPAGQQ